MAIHKLHIDEFDEVDYELIAIHTSLEDYRLAYFLNQKLPILLRKSKNEIQINIKEGVTFFSRFIYENTNTDCCWSLVQNKNEVTSLNTNNNPNLFGESSFEVATKAFLLPELKKVDYFLKIENLTNGRENASIIDFKMGTNTITCNIKSEQRLLKR
jgi:hypothetical protein